MPNGAATVENSVVIPNENQTEISCDSAIPLLSTHYPKELKAETQMDTWMLIFRASFTIGKR